MILVLVLMRSNFYGGYKLNARNSIEKLSCNIFAHLTAPSMKQLTLCCMKIIKQIK